jgi:hypothetical protein
MLALILVLFLPWNQNIRSEGSITALRPEQRPQQINNFIPGRIVKWWVKEGDLVKKGDTIVQLAEIKDSYLDPNLMGRTEEQLDAEKKSISTRIHCWDRPRFVSNLITSDFSYPSFRVKFGSLQFLGRLLSDKK